MGMRPLYERQTPLKIALQHEWGPLQHRVRHALRVPPTSQQCDQQRARVRLAESEGDGGVGALLGGGGEPAQRLVAAADALAALPVDDTERSPSPEDPLYAADGKDAVVEAPVATARAISEEEAVEEAIKRSLYEQ